MLKTNKELRACKEGRIVNKIRNESMESDNEFRRVMSPIMSFVGSVQMTRHHE